MLFSIYYKSVFVADTHGSQSITPHEITIELVRHFKNVLDIPYVVITSKPVRLLSYRVH